MLCSMVLAPTSSLAPKALHMFGFHNLVSTKDDTQNGAKTHTPIPPKTTSCLPGGSGSTADSDAMFAKELASLSLEERQKNENDLHGVPDVVEETEEFIQTKQQGLAYELNTHKHDHAAYQLAETDDPEYVHDFKFRLMFLRADGFDVKAAAMRMFRFFEKKLELFGRTSLSRPLLLEDLDETDLQLYHRGLVQILPVKDRAGRPFIFSQGVYDMPIRNIMRAHFYLLMTLVEDEEAQRKGWGAVLWKVNRPHINLDSLVNTIHLHISYLPVRTPVGHTCFDSDMLKPLLGAAMLATGKGIRHRLRFHFGTEVECRYALMSFGIPTYAFPLDANGDATVFQLQLWLEQRKMHDRNRAISNVKKDYLQPDERSTSPMDADNFAVEGLHITTPPPPSPPRNNSVACKSPMSASVASNIVTGPSTHDVLLGRGVPLQQHPGNVYYRQLVSSHAESYESANRFQKTMIAELIVACIKDSGGRFLKSVEGEEDDAWEMIDDREARIKVASAFRFLRKQKKKIC